LLLIQNNMTVEFPQIKQEQAKSKGEVQLEEVAELEAPIKKIIEKIKNRIENGEYGLIIGDDASGRIPTRILGDFIRDISKIKGHYQPNIIFIPGRKFNSLGSDSKESMFQKQFEQYISKFGAVSSKKILVITDTVYSGESLIKLANLIKNAGYVLEIATIGQEFEGPLGRPDSLADENLEGIEIISGEFQAKKEQEEKTGWAHTPMIYANKKMSGVYKTSGQLKSERLIDKHGSGLERDQVQYEVERSRKNAKIMTNKLVDWYLGLSDEK